ncbi:beta-lactamase family protein [Colletotrichum asianum]|uniref:Beta-lactamase family protein n=1 Tax=Colletotrichum asianum TaxID=702518 RepID=A0A8H3WSS8_9PEZI|nr:beta-lactamase family protein [Colletotrichum asianum]
MSKVVIASNSVLYMNRKFICQSGIVFSRCLGRAKKDSNEEITLETLFSGFSCTKLLTTICVLQLTERGLINLDDEVGSILPELKSPDIISEGPEGSFQLKPATNKITLRHLITHTSGLSYDAMHPLLVAWRKSRGEEPLVMSGRVREAFSLPLLFEPGTSWVYGAGLDWAGILIERMSGKALSIYMDENIFKPLGLRRSTFHLQQRPDIEKDAAQMWLRNDTGELVPIPSPYPVDAQDDSGGMGLITFTSDFASVLRDLLRDTPLLLKVETVETMFIPQFQHGSPMYDGLLKQKSMHDQLTGDSSGCPQVAFGLGGLVTQGTVPNLPAKTLTWNGMPNIGWSINREQRIGATFVTQLLPPGDSKSVGILGEFWRELWARHADFEAPS